MVLLQGWVRVDQGPSWQCSEVIGLLMVTGLVTAPFPSRKPTCSSQLEGCVCMCERVSLCVSVHICVLCVCALSLVICFAPWEWGEEVFEIHRKRQPYPTSTYVILRAGLQDLSPPGCSQGSTKLGLGSVCSWGPASMVHSLTSPQAPRPFVSPNHKAALIPHLLFFYPQNAD